LQIASASAELQQRQQNYAKRKRHKYITASTQEYKYAAYQEAWRQKVERIGRLNYPEAARQRKLTGDLTMTVAIRADGSVASISLDRSSGYKLLDDAARRIVRLASPFAPLPDNIRAETDVLHITRTWIFHDGASFGSR
jgi:protein TonB